MTRLAHPAFFPTSAAPALAAAASFWDEDRAYDEYLTTFGATDYIDEAEEVREAIGMRIAPSVTRTWS